MDNMRTAVWCYSEAGEYDINDEFPPSKAELRRLVERAATKFRELGAIHRKAWENAMSKRVELIAEWLEVQSTRQGTEVTVSLADDRAEELLIQICQSFGPRRVLELVPELEKGVGDE